jgi:hypothetical protein
LIESAQVITNRSAELERLLAICGDPLLVVVDAAHAVRLFEHGGSREAGIRPSRLP